MGCLCATPPLYEVCGGGVLGKAVPQGAVGTAQRPELRESWDSAVRQRGAVWGAAVCAHPRSGRSVAPCPHPACCACFQSGTPPATGAT